MTVIECMLGVVFTGLLGNFFIRRVKSRIAKRLIFAGTSIAMIALVIIVVF